MAKFDKSLLMNAIVLAHANKNAEMKADLNALFSENWLTVDKLLKMQWEDFLLTNANEVMGTGATGFWAEFVEKEILYTELTQRITNETSLISALNIKTMFADVEIFPVEGEDVYMINATEATDKATWTTPSGQNQRAGTLNFTVTAKDIVVTIEISDKLVRRSVIDIANYVLNKIAKAFETSIHNLILNGDTATADNTNINAIDWVTADLPQWGAKSTLLNNDWARKIAFSSSATVDAGSNLDLSIIRSARAKMGIKGLRPSELTMAIESSAYFELLGLTQAETLEKFGNSATVINWILAAIDWMRVIPRTELGKTKADWKISKTAGNNVKGQAVIIYTPSVAVWIREWLATEEQRYASEKITAITWSAVVWVTIENLSGWVSSALIYNI